MIKHEVARTLDGSIAREMGISRGDFLRAINGDEVRDILDYRFKVMDENLLVEIEKPDGEIWELEIEKDLDEDLGIEFKQSLMSGTRRCRNKCVFCFIDQQPQGLRPTLYVKDDDARLSFLLGNYVTLTNLDEDEIRRLAGYHLSPLRISVHAADLDLREKMMGAPQARNLFDAINIFCDAGVEMHFQVVLCKGLNDGDQLENTVGRLAQVKTAKSLAIVPAGLTRHRDGLFPLAQFGREDARKIIRQVGEMAGLYRGQMGIFLSDEWYVLAGGKLPKYSEYRDFPQLDNGVGVLRLFEREFTMALREAMASGEGLLVRTLRKLRGRHIGIITGRAAEGFMDIIARRFTKIFGTKITVYGIDNKFFGESVTVSGLLTGRDVIRQLKQQFENSARPNVIFLPENALRAGVQEQVMLDGISLGTLQKKLALPVKVGKTNGRDFCRKILSQT